MKTNFLNGHDSVRVRFCVELGKGYSSSGNDYMHDTVMINGRKMFNEDL